MVLLLAVAGLAGSGKKQLDTGAGMSHKEMNLVMMVSISEVLTVVRSLQQQVSALQAQRSVTPTVNTNLDSSTGSASGKNKRLPKTLVVSSHVLKLVGEQFLFAYFYLTQSAVHQTVERLKDIAKRGPS